MEKGYTIADWSERYRFSEANVKACAPAAWGVYRLIYRSGDSYHVFYVGQSEDLNARLLQHLQVSESNTCIRKFLHEHTCFFRFLKVGTQADRMRIEQEQLKKYNPTCNAT